ncbi:Crp/Fnr family transcriptional regulator [Roseospirillum parvum]|uniref:Crp/Fnr family transcriptional regulator n=1 Tax=Roseospirillum parvum TaxID=83401 RepID=UPI001FE008B9|nr:Crp/Fnr family transcriptional regulator [Roseospirillum parvum]
MIEVHSNPGGGAQGGGNDELGRIPLFAGLAPAERAAIARQCRWRRFAAGEQIIDRQSESRDVFFVVSGRVRVIIYSVAGREVTLDDLLAGDFFGELAAIDGNPRSASVMALEETRLAVVGGSTFLDLVLGRPALALAVMARMVGIIRNSTDRIMDLSTLGANNRVHGELLRLARLGDGGEGPPVIRPIPVHSDLASRVSTTRETVARVLNDLARRDIVRRERDALVIVDAARLHKMVEDVRGD